MTGTGDRKGQSPRSRTLGGGGRLREPAAKAPGPGIADSGADDGRRRGPEFYAKTARNYDHWLGHYERWMGLRPGRRRLLARARGRTLEVGVGTGVNLPLYPASVELTGIDLSPAMLDIARERAAELGRKAELRIGNVENLDFTEDAFDTVVATLFLSAVPEQRRALAEIRRVLKPDGRLLVLDQVRTTSAPVRWLQRLVEPVAVRFAGWHLARDLINDLTSAGFAIEAYRRSKLGMVAELVARS